jgi:predicted DCC family thiol-disulfide oxidoreductase YuxK
VVLVESPGTAFIRSEAVVRAAKAIGAPPALLAAALAGPVPLKARDSAYDAVADNRYSLFGKSDEERWTREGEEEGRFLV